MPSAEEVSGQYCQGSNHDVDPADPANLHNSDKEGNSKTRKNVNAHRLKRRSAYRARHRLLSIKRDASCLKERVLLASSRSSECSSEASLARSFSKDWPWIANKQCGSWYLPSDEDHIIPSSTSPTSPTSATNKPTDKPRTKLPSCYFKSTDGHIKTYAISLKRLNLQLIEFLHHLKGDTSGDDNDKGVGVYLVDSSVRKLLPDSFSRTIPIWCCVMNRVVEQYRRDFGLNCQNEKDDDDGEKNNNDGDKEINYFTELYTPACIVSPEEHLKISNLIDSRVELLHQSKAIVDPQRLVEILAKPLRAFWVADGQVLEDTLSIHSPIHSANSMDSKNYYNSHASSNNFYSIVCVNPSFYFQGSSPKNHIHWINSNNSINTENCGRDENDASAYDDGCKEKYQDNSIDKSTNGYYYTPGAADDEATWALGLTSDIFWKYSHRILDASLSDDETDEVIQNLVKGGAGREVSGHLPDNEILSTSFSGFDRQNQIMIQEHQQCMDKIGNMELYLGSRKAGKPPYCWEYIDVILNVTQDEYPNIHESIKSIHQKRKQHTKNSIERTHSPNDPNINQIYYLQMPIPEGKKDKSNLEQWLPVGLYFIFFHLQRGRSVLVHCAQGKDSSVAVVLAFVALFCPLKYPLRLRDGFVDVCFDDCFLSCLQLQPLRANANGAEEVSQEKDELYLKSGLTHSLVNAYLSDEGHDLFLKHMHNQFTPTTTPISPSTTTAQTTTTMARTTATQTPSPSLPISPLLPLATKESLRIALHLVRQDRGQAEPSRSTMQKLNRFFMSSALYRSPSTDGK